MVLAYKRLSFAQARAALVRHCLDLVGEEPSTNKARQKDRNPEGRHERWWLKRQGHVPSHDSPRSIAYLKAYTEIAGPCFFGTGIPLTDGYMHPDKGVMKSMLMSRCVVLDSQGRFELTDKGQALILDASNDD